MRRLSVAISCAFTPLPSSLSPLLASPSDLTWQQPLGSRTMVRMLFLVDGYNVTKGDPATCSLSLEAQRDELVARLRSRGEQLLGRGSIVVVFDGEVSDGPEWARALGDAPGRGRVLARRVAPTMPSSSERGASGARYVS